MQGLHVPRVHLAHRHRGRGHAGARRGGRCRVCMPGRASGGAPLASYLHWMLRKWALRHTAKAGRNCMSWPCQRCKHVRLKRVCGASAEPRLCLERQCSGYGPGLVILPLRVILACLDVFAVGFHGRLCAGRECSSGAALTACARARGAARRAPSSCWASSWRCCAATGSAR
jgi:hypothetical protein